MRVLITGSTGMVGRNLLEHPATQAYDVAAPNRAELDLRDYDAVVRYLKRVKPDIIIHAAGKVGGIHANIRQPVEFLVENLDIGRNVVMAARASRVPRLLNLGSSCMYPRDGEHPLREESILTGALEPTNEGYALAKIAVARLCEYASQVDASLAFKTLIPCNLYGRHDHFDPGGSHLVAAVIEKLHQAKVTGMAEVDIWGDGSARREFLLTSDLADCIWRAVVEFHGLPSMMNVGVGRDHSVLEYYQAAADVIGYTGTFRFDLSKPVGMKQKLVSTERLRRWGWHPRHDLRTGLQQTYQYYLERHSSPRDRTQEDRSHTP
jgi:GDP-L-fucose synthase